jgi:hypothetical protein
MAKNPPLHEPLKCCMMVQNNRNGGRKGMVDTKMHATIQEYRAKGFSIRQTSRELEADKKTIGKYRTMDEEDYAQYLLEPA